MPDAAALEYKAAVEAVALARLMLAEHREQYDALIEQTRSMESIGFALDPTLYRQMIWSKGLQGHLRIARAAVAFLDDVGAVMREAEACEPSSQPSR